MTNLCLLTCLASTLFMTGVIWFVQVVHYPLFNRVALDSFRRYHADHTRTTSFVVIVPMVLELLSSVALVFQPPTLADRWLAWVGLALVLVSWAVTFFCSVPAHDRLANGFDEETHRNLVGMNGVRVLSWSAHSLVLLVMTARALG
jgi:hypothetical protein